MGNEAAAAARGGAFSDVVKHARALLQLEVDLAREEARAAVAAARRSLLLAVVGLVLGVLALQALLGAFVLVLAVAWPPWLAAAVVGLLLAVGCAVMMRAARKQVGGDALRPTATLDSLRQTKQWLTSKL